MQCLTFITDTDGRSGKVASRKARTVIRAHVMRKHWVDKSTSFRQKSYSVASRQTKVNEAVCSSSPVERIAIAEKTASPRRDQSSSGTAIPRGESSQGLFLTRHLTRVMDDFVYAGSSIDLQSYGHFQHYSSEFSIILPNSIHPLPLKRASASCVTAIQQSSTVLLKAVCFMAAFHECMKRTKDSCGRLVTSLSDKKVLKSKTETIQELSDHLTKDPQSTLITEADILCVTILLFSETVAGDQSAVNTHLLGLIRMIELYGGQHSLSPIVLTHLQFATLLAAQLDQTRPKFPLHPAIQDRYDRISTAPFPPPGGFLNNCGVGSAFFSRSMSLALSDSLQQSLRYMARVIARIEKVQDHIQVFEGDWMDDVLALEHILISLPHNRSLNQLEECVRLSALVYCNTALWRIPLYFRWVMSLVVRLKSALLSLKAWAYPELHFWMLFLGRQACTLEFSASETAWWNAAITGVAEELDVSTWEQARQVFLEFFYVERVHTARWKTVWTDVVNGSRSAEPVVRDPEHPCDYA